MFCCINMKSSEIKIVNGDIYFMKFIIIYLFKSGIMLSIFRTTQLWGCQSFKHAWIN